MAGFLQDDKGNSSSARLIMVAVFATLCLSYLTVTAAAVWKGDIKMVDIPGGVLAFAGIVWAGKEIQKVIENKGTAGGTP